MGGMNMLSGAPYHVRFWVTLVLTVIFTALLVGIARKRHVKGFEKRLKWYQIAGALLLIWAGFDFFHYIAIGDELLSIYPEASSVQELVQDSLFQGIVKAALGFGILFLYGLMPAAILGTSLASGLLRPYGRMSWVVVPAAAVLYLLLPWLTFGLANTLSFGRLNPPDPVALAAGAVVSAAGFGIGAGVRALRARRRGA